MSAGVQRFSVIDFLPASRHQDSPCFGKRLDGELTGNYGHLIVAIGCIACRQHPGVFTDGLCVVAAGVGDFTDIIGRNQSTFCDASDKFRVVRAVILPRIIDRYCNGSGCDLDSHVFTHQIDVSGLDGLRVDGYFALGNICYKWSFRCPAISVYLVVDGVPFRSVDLSTCKQRRSIIDLEASGWNQSCSIHRTRLDNKVSGDDRYLIVSVLCVIGAEDIGICSDSFIRVRSAVRDFTEVAFCNQSAFRNIACKLRVGGIKILLSIIHGDGDGPRSDFDIRISGFRLVSRVEDFYIYRFFVLHILTGGLCCGPIAAVCAVIDDITCKIGIFDGDAVAISVIYTDVIYRTDGPVCRTSFLEAEACVVCRTFGGCVTDGHSIIYQHVVRDFVFFGIIPSIELILFSWESGGTDGFSDRIHIRVAVDGCNGVIVRDFICAAIFDLPDVGLPYSVGEACIIGIHAFFGLSITVRWIGGNQLAAGTVPALKYKTVICRRCCGYGLICLGVVGFSSMLIVTGVIVFGVTLIISDTHSSACRRVYIRFVSIDLRNESLPPSPLSYHRQAIMDVSISNAFTVVLPDDTGWDTVVILDGFRQMDIAIIDLEILGGILAARMTQVIIARNGVFRRQNQSTKFLRRSFCCAVAC